MNFLLVKRPVVTEKAVAMSHGGKYVFVVDGQANAPAVKKLIRERYHVDVVNINLMNVAGKERRLGRMRGFKAGYKKAIVTLKKGQKLDILPH